MTAAGAGDRLRLAVDAANLVRDRRGMGRLVRGVLAEAARDASIDVTLLAASRRDRRALRDEFVLTTETARVVDDTRAASRRGRFDVVWFPFNGMRYRVAAPSLVLVHDVFAFTEPHPDWIARRRERAPIARAARLATAISTTTQWNRGEIARELPIALDRIAAIAPEPDAYFTPDSTGAAPEDVPAERFVLAVGGVETRKNLAMLIGACARAFAGRDERLVVAGAMRAEDERLATAAGLRFSRVDADDARLRDLYRAAALVAVPSRAEGFGLVAVEAMACGAPVIAAGATGLREAVRGAAQLLPPNDAAAWAAAIRSLLDDDEARRALARHGADTFARSDRGRHARETLAALRALAVAGG